MSTLMENLKEMGMGSDEAKILESIIRNGSIPFKTLLSLTGIGEEELKKALNRLEGLKLVLNIDGKYIALPPLELFIENLFNTANEIKKMINKFTEETGEPIEITVKKLEELQDTALNKLVSLTAEESLNKLKSIMDSIENQILNFNQRVERLKETLKTVLKEIDDTVSVIKNARRGIEEALNIGYESILKSIESKELDWRETIEKTLSDKLKGWIRIQKSFEDFKTVVDGIKNLATGTLDDVVKRVNGVVNALEKALPEIAIGLSKALESSLNLLKEGIAGEIEGYKSSALKRVSDINKFVIEKLNKSKKDVKDGYSSILEETYKNIETELDYYTREFESLVKEIKEAIVGALEEKSKLLNEEKEKISKVFETEFKKLELTPEAYNKAIMQSTELIIKEFHETFHDRMKAIRQLEEDTWRWFSEKIIETADKIIATSDNLLLGYGDLLENLNKNITILNEYILSLPDKIYTNIDREWRNFLEEGLDRFKMFIDDVNKEIQKTTENMEAEIGNILNATVRALNNSDENHKTILIEFFKSNGEMLKNDLTLVKSKINDVLKNETIEKDYPDVFNTLREANQLIDKIITERTEKSINDVSNFVVKTFEDRTKDVSKIFENMKNFFNDKMKRSREVIFDTFEGVKGGYIEDLNTLIETVRIIYGSHLEALNELISVILNKIKTKVEETGKEVEKIINEHSDDMVKIFRESTGVIKERIDSFLRSFESELNKFPQTYKEAIEKISSDTMKMLQEINKNLLGTLNQSKLKTTESIDSTLNKITEIRSGLTKIYENWGGKVSQLAIKIENDNKKFAKEGGQLISEYIDTIFNEAIDMLNLKVKEIEEAATTILDDFVEKTINNLENYKNNALNNTTASLEQFLEPIRLKIKEMRSQVDDANSKLNEIMTSEEFQLEGLLNKLDELKSDLNIVISNILDGTIEELKGLIEEDILSNVRLEKERILNSFGEILEKILKELDKIKMDEASITSLIDKREVNEVLEGIMYNFNMIITKFDEFKQTYKGMMNEVEKTLREGVAGSYTKIASKLEDIFLTINRYYIFLVNFQKLYEQGIKDTLKMTSVIKSKPIALSTLEGMLKEAKKTIQIYINCEDEKVIKKIMTTLKEKTCTIYTVRRLYPILEKMKTGKKLGLITVTLDIPHSVLAVIDNKLLITMDTSSPEARLTIISEPVTIKSITKLFK